MRKAGRKALSLVLSVYMALSVGVSDFSIASYAADNPAQTNHLWTKVEFNQISAGDSIAITMTSDKGTYVLPNAQATDGGPKAKLANVVGDMLSIPEGEDDEYAWNITQKTIEVKSKDMEETGAEPDAGKAEEGTVDETVDNSGKTVSDGSNVGTDKSENDGNGETGTAKVKEEQPTNQSNGSTAIVTGSNENNKETGTGSTQAPTGNNDGVGKTDVTATENTGKTELDDKTKALNPALNTNQPEEPKKAEEPSGSTDKENSTVEEYYTISSGNNYLYTNAANNGVRISDSKPDNDVGAKWKIDDGYLCTEDSKNAVRYLGVYSGTDFRAYTKKSDGTIANNIKDQTLAFYKLTDKKAPEVILAPTASVKSGETVEIGTEITLSCATTDAKIYFNTNDTKNFSEYKEPIKITEDTTINAYSTKNNGDSEKVSFAYTVKEKEKFTENTVGKLLTREFYDGDVVVAYYPAQKELMTATEVSTLLGAKTGKYQSENVAPSEDGTMDISGKDALVLKVSVDENGKCTLKTQDGKYLTATVEKNAITSKTTCALKLADSAEEYSTWNLQKAGEDGKFLLVNDKAKNGSFKVALEYYNRAFTSYGISSDTSAFEFNFYALEEGKKVEKTESDSNTELIVAQWAGNANYDEAGIADKKVINGDLYSTNDMLDENAKYSVVVNGEKVQPYTSAKSSTTGSTSYYMGSTGVISNTDYIQMEFPTEGYANMNLSFRMRSSNTAVGAYQLQYSTTGEDGSFKNFSEGSYSYKYTSYRDDKPTEVSDSKQISDGIAKTSVAPTNYVEFSFKIPEGANNREKVYVRLVPATTLSAKGDKDAGKGGANRIDTVIVTGHPVVSDKICGHVIADPASGEIEKGAKIALLTGTEGADIYYSINGAEEVKYDAGNQITLTELPAIIRARAVKEGLKDSVTCVYQYTQAQVATVKAAPNGGAIAATQKITLSTKTENAKIFYRYMTDEEIEKNVVESVEQQNAEEGQEPAEAAQEEAHNDWIEYTQPFELKELPSQIQVKAVKEGCLDSAVSTLKFTKRTNERENIYFGQIHAHTNISDGAGSLEDALSHASKVNNLDFIIITDHSNSIDNEKNSKITENVDTSENDEWTYAHNLVKKYSTDKFTCAYGYEMTWSNGLGHMNTFNTKGFQSRTQKDYSTYSTALNNYYAALRTAPDSISQFNHPGTTFGDFQDFAYYSEENDALITMIEVGNGEGAIGSSGYFPSYEYYIRALDKGWHVAPTNNQDNHKGLWGDANTARTVMLADTNSEEAIYDAMRNYRIYATEDNDLSIYYTLNNNVMGSILDKDAVGDTVELKADIKDPTDSAIGKVEVIVNGGKVVASQNIDKSEATVSFTVPSAYSYYFIKISQNDKDIAVTAPVWVGKVEACGINNVYTDTVLPVAGEPFDINVDLYNNEKTPLEIKDIAIELSDVDGKKVPVCKVSGADAKVTEVASNGTASYKTSYVYNEAGQVTYEVTVTALLNGIEKIYKDKIAVNYAVPKMVSNVIIDGTHYNDYVSGYYTGNVNAFINLCAKKNIRATVVKDNITSDMLKDCKLLVLSAPGKNNKDSSRVSHYSDDFVKMVKEYVAGGGSVIVCGLADYSDTTDCQTATEQNKILEAIGATIRMGSDEVCDDTNNGGQVFRMYPTVFNKESALLAGIKDGQKYSQYSGCSVDISNAKATNFVDEAEWLVNGFETTYSVDCKDGAGKSIGGKLPNGKVSGVKLDNDGKVTFIARQKTKAGGQIIVSGGVFLSDFEVKAEMDNNDSLPYANHTIVNNILEGSTVELETTTIAKARKGKMNEVFAVEGYVTSGTDNQNTTFFDTIYIQDETGGMDIFPYATPGLKIGTKMRIVGYLAQYQGDLELKVISAKELKADPKVWEPKAVDTKTAMDYDKLGGQLLKTTGNVTRVDYNADGTVAEFWLKDASGAEAAIFIDGYIRSAKTGKNTVGEFVKKDAKVTAAGVLYKHPEGKSDVSVPVLRVRNCDDIVLAGKADDKKSDAVKDNKGTDNKKTDNKKSDAVKDNKGKDNKKNDNKKSDAVKDNKGKYNKKTDNKKSDSVKDNKNTDNKKTDNKKSDSVNGKKKSDNNNKKKKDNSVLGAKKKKSDNKATDKKSTDKKAADSNKKDSSDNSTEAKSTDVDNSSTENEDSKDSAQTADSQTDNGAEQDKQEDNGKKKFKLPELPNIPKKFVAIGAGAVGVVALVIFVISHIAAGVSAGAAAGASAAAGAAAASGGKLAGLLSKIRHLFGKK